MAAEPIVVRTSDLDPGAQLAGETLVVGSWSASGVATEVAPLHVHHGDDEAWHVVSGALRFRFADRELVADAGTTVLVPAGVPHTFGNAGPEPSRYLIILTPRLSEMISKLHEVTPAEHAEVYRRYASELLE